MSKNGGLYLDNAVVIELYARISEYQKIVEDALYKQYKNAYKITKSNYFKGKGAESFKAYMTDGAVNILTGMMDVSAEMTIIANLIAELFLGYESDERGRIEDNAIEYIKGNLNSKERVFEGAKNELRNAINAASAYIRVTSLDEEVININYDRVRNQLSEIRNNLETYDSIALDSANELYERILSQKNYINNIMNYCYRDNGKLKPGSLNNVKDQSWYNKSSNVQLYIKLQEDPFEYAAGEVTVAENQWAIGLCSDVYAYAGYSFLSASYEAGLEDGTAFINARAHVVSANAYAQFTDYLHAQAETNIVFGEIEAKAGTSGDYIGFRVDAEVGIIDVEGSIVLGSDDLNAFVKGEGKVLCADGKVAFELPNENGEFAIGAKGSADAVNASVTGGLSFLKYNKTVYDKETGLKTSKENLFNFKIKPEAGVSASGGIWLESSTALEGEYATINAFSIDIKAKALLGLELSVTIPTVHLKPLWTW